MTRSLLLLILCLAIPGTAIASGCRPDALGTARVLAVDAAQFPRVGRQHFPQTLPLSHKEIVLTFDDGPSAATTGRVLDALAAECVRATFFLLGRNAAAHPALVRRIAAAGHSIGTHTYSHPLLSRLSTQQAEAEIDRGIRAIELALDHDDFGSFRPKIMNVIDSNTLEHDVVRKPLHTFRHHAPGGHAAPFFRFPGYASTPALLDRLTRRGLVVFGSDAWASDWNRMTPEAQLQLVLGRIEKTGGGILLFHDTQPQTAAMLPGFLRALKARGFRIVHTVSTGAVALR